MTVWNENEVSAVWNKDTKYSFFKSIQDIPSNHFNLYDSDTYALFIGEELAPSVHAGNLDYYTWNVNTFAWEFVCKLALLPYGYKCYTGHVLPDIQVDSINAITLRLRKRCEVGAHISDEHLNERHRVFNQYACTPLLANQ